ncbi:MAG: class I SAM-dependent methyltransferase [Verrucomicrobia bacterium]|nr:class I SAM-dependent methyltransferase [Verrucomicrobiota bacterium]
MLHRRHEYQKMSEVERGHWWYRALHHLVRAALASHPRGSDARVVDAGCGTGGLLMFLRDRGYHHLSGFDLCSDAVARCRERGLVVQSGDLRQLEAAGGTPMADAIISNDTLYFFTPEKRRDILRRCWEALAARGLLVLNVPALPAFRGIHDLSVGIQHRFSRPEVARLLASAGFELVQVRFWPFLLSPFICSVRLSQRWRMRHGPGFKIKSDIDLPPAWLNRCLEGLTRLENAWLPWTPFGSSLFVVGRKAG